MSQVIALNIVFSGSLSEIKNYLDANNLFNNNTLLLALNKEAANDLEEIAGRRDHLDTSDDATRLYPILGEYAYGFDIRASNGCLTELSFDESDKTVFHVVNGLAGEVRAPEPAEQVKTAVLPPNVTALSSDDLFSIVANYDVIHREARAELSKRIGAVQDKLV